MTVTIYILVKSPWIIYSSVLKILLVYGSTEIEVGLVLQKKNERKAIFKKHEDGKLRVQ